MSIEFTLQALENQEAIILVLQKRLKIALGTGNTMPPEYAVIVSNVLLATIEGYTHLRLKESTEEKSPRVSTNGDELENIIR